MTKTITFFLHLNLENFQITFINSFLSRAFQQYQEHSQILK
jgi:hypothetical protein